QAPWQPASATGRCAPSNRRSHCRRCNRRACPGGHAALSSHAMTNSARRPLMQRVLRIVFGFAIVLLIAAGPPLYNMHVNRTYRNFRVVKPGILYRSGQLTHEGLQRLIHDHGFRTVISLRDAYTPGEPPPDLDEEEYCLK